MSAKKGPNKIKIKKLYSPKRDPGLMVGPFSPVYPDTRAAQ